MVTAVTPTASGGSSIFGNFLDRATNLGQGFLDFSFEKFKFNEELALAERYRSGAAEQAAINRGDVRVTNTDNFLKYGIIAVIGLVAVLAVTKAIK